MYSYPDNRIILCIPHSLNDYDFTSIEFNYTHLHQMYKTELITVLPNYDQYPTILSDPILFPNNESIVPFNIHMMWKHNQNQKSTMVLILGFLHFLVTGII